MEITTALKEHIRNQIISSFPKGFLEDMQKRAQTAYIDTFGQVSHDTTVLPQQRIHKLRQDRCFRMDYELAKAAEKFGFPFTANHLAENDWQFTYATINQFGVTQSYVQKIGDLPNPAKFRERLANASNIPRFPLDDDPEIFKARDFYGLFTHNPIGSDFKENSQRLGSLRICIPCEGMKAWALEVSVPELIGLYPAEEKDKLAVPSPMWKTAAKKRAAGES